MFYKTKKKKYPDPGPKMCHPRVGKVRPKNGCFPDDVLERLTGTRKRKLALKKFDCPEGSETCLIDKSTLAREEKEKIEKMYLRPRKPAAWFKKRDTWLDNYNIRDVMNQYEEVYKDFKFIDPVPIDFSMKNEANGKCISNDMCQIDLNKLKSEGITKLGIIYNLDKSTGGGSHWMANYIDLAKHNAYFFDSYGLKPHENIQYFMRYLKTMDPLMKLHYSGRRFQFKGSECGMYSLYFIVMMMRGMNFRKFVRMEIPDDIMLEYRDWMFSS